MKLQKQRILISKFAKDLENMNHICAKLFFPSNEKEKERDRLKRDRERERKYNQRGGCKGIK